MNLYIGNIAYNVTEQDLRQHFSAYSSIEKLTIIKDRETGRSKGFGFIEMSSNSEAAEAIKSLNGSTLSGRALRVNEAKPKNH